MDHSRHQYWCTDVLGLDVKGLSASQCCHLARCWILWCLVLKRNRCTQIRSPDEAADAVIVAWERPPLIISLGGDGQLVVISERHVDVVRSSLIRYGTVTTSDRLRSSTGFSPPLQLRSCKGHALLAEKHPYLWCSQVSRQRAICAVGKKPVLHTLLKVLSEQVLGCKEVSSVQIVIGAAEECFQMQAAVHAIKK